MYKGRTLIRREYNVNTPYGEWGIAADTDVNVSTDGVEDEHRETQNLRVADVDENTNKQGLIVSTEKYSTRCQKVTGWDVATFPPVTLGRTSATTLAWQYVLFQYSEE